MDDDDVGTVAPLARCRVTGPLFCLLPPPPLLPPSQQESPSPLRREREREEKGPLRQMSPLLFSSLPPSIFGCTRSPFGRGALHANLSVGGLDSMGWDREPSKEAKWNVLV